MGRLKGQGSTAPLWRTVAPERRDSLFKNIEYFALRGFHAQKIADICGCNKSQIYMACQKLQIKLRDYRDGKGEVAVRIIQLRPAIVKLVRRKAGG